MELAKLLQSVQYVTDPQGNRQSVLLDLNMWEAIVNHLKYSVSERGIADERERDMAREEVAYQAMHAELWTKYPHQHVAIYQGQLVDHDRDAAALYLRIRQKYPGEFVLMAPVGPEPEEEYHILSPQLVAEG